MKQLSSVIAVEILTQIFLNKLNKFPRMSRERLQNKESIYIPFLLSKWKIKRKFRISILSSLFSVHENIFAALNSNIPKEYASIFSNIAGASNTIEKSQILGHTKKDIYELQEFSLKSLITYNTVGLAVITILLTTISILNTINHESENRPWIIIVLSIAVMAILLVFLIAYCIPLAFKHSEKLRTKIRIPQ